MERFNEWRGISIWDIEEELLSGIRHEYEISYDR